MSTDTIMFQDTNFVCKDCLLDDILSAGSIPYRNKNLGCKQVIDYSKGEVLLKAGDVVSGIYLIREGIVKVTKKGNGKKEFILWIAGPGDIVGLNSFINDAVYSFSASAIDRVSACFIPYSLLSILWKEEPAAFVRLMRKMCSKLDFVEQRITSISRKSIKAQCAEILVSIASISNPEKHKMVSVNYSISDLASLVGTTKNYLYKVLLEFAKENILFLRNRKIVVSNMDALSLIAMGNEG